jgi:transposase
VLSVEDWAEIRRLHFAEGLGIKTIAKRLGVARNTVRTALRPGHPPAYRRPRRPSAVDPYEDQIQDGAYNCELSLSEERELGAVVSSQQLPLPHPDSTWTQGGQARQA